jgi:hypothetical protein
MSRGVVDPNSRDANEHTPFSIRNVFFEFLLRWVTYPLTLTLSYKGRGKSVRRRAKGVPVEYASHSTG